MTTFRIEADAVSGGERHLSFYCSGVKITECPPLEVGKQYEAEMDKDTIWVTTSVQDGKKTKSVHARYAIIQVKEPSETTTK